MSTGRYEGLPVEAAGLWRKTRTGRTVHISAGVGHVLCEFRNAGARPRATPGLLFVDSPKPSDVCSTCLSLFREARKLP